MLQVDAPTLPDVRYALLKYAQSITHGPTGLDRNESSGGNGDLDSLSSGHLTNSLTNGLGLDTAKIKALAARDDGCGQFVGFGGGQNKQHMRWWLLESLEQGIKSLGRQHMYFIDYVDLVARFAWSILDVFPKFANFIDAPIRSGIDFKNI